MEGNGEILTPNDLPSSPGETEEGKWIMNPRTVCLVCKGLILILLTVSGGVRIMNVEPDAEVFKS